MSNLLKVKELQEYLNVSRQTIYEWRKNGMPFKKIGRSVRFDYEEVKAWIERSQTGS